MTTVKVAATVPRSTSGFDPGKKIPGRKRHIVVDLKGLLLFVMVTPADTHEAVAAKEVLLRLRLMHPQIAVVWADSIYGGTLVDWAKSFLNLTVKTVTRSEGLRSPPQHPDRSPPFNPRDPQWSLRRPPIRHRTGCYCPVQDRSRSWTASRFAPLTRAVSMSSGSPDSIAASASARILRASPAFGTSGAASISEIDLGLGSWRGPGTVASVPRSYGRTFSAGARSTLRR
ncbi:transposase [Streptomyces lutosisoli]|uniref:transposase n=1 Tax=Streptomyces lutosisoli TaxID=2665721 RepID=UPI003AA7E3F9